MRIISRLGQFQNVLRLCWRATLGGNQKVGWKVKGYRLGFIIVFLVKGVKIRSKKEKKKIKEVNIKNL